MEAELVEGEEGWTGLGIREILDADSRPTFVIDLDPDEAAADSTAPGDASRADGSPSPLRPILPVFCNTALRSHERLAEALVGKNARGLHTVTTPAQEEPPATYDEFKAWATGVTPHDDSKDVFPLSFLYGDMLWTGSTVRRRWRFVAGNCLWRAGLPVVDLSAGTPVEVATVNGEQFPVQQLVRPLKVAKKEPAPEDPEAQPLAESEQTGSATLVASASDQVKPTKPYFYPKASNESSTETAGTSYSASIQLAAPEKAVTDWTVAEPKGILSPHQQYARSINWGATPVGPMESWSSAFRQAANLMMGNPHPAALFWGSELTMLYNEAYSREVAGNKHPGLMGTGFSGPFAELWDYAGPVFAECARTGISVRKENDYLPINRYGLLEETFYSWSFTPLYGGTNRIRGFYNAPFETTTQVISQRRRDMIYRIGEQTGPAKMVKQFWGLLLKGLETEERDVPFALLYSIGDSEDADFSSISSESTISAKSCYLEGTIGVPSGHPAAPQQLDLKRSREGFVPSFREAMRTREPMLLHTRDGTLPEALLEGIQLRGFEDPCREAIIFPVRPTNGDNVLAFLVLGVNPRRPYNDEYKLFVGMLNRQMATSLASTILFEDETRRSRDAAEAAALEKERLTQQLDMQASRLRRMTELSPLGLFLVSPDGVLREANDRFYEMTAHTRDSQYEMSWTDFISPNSAETMAAGWRRLVEAHEPWSGELQLKKRASSLSQLNLPGEAMESWVLFIAQPELQADGSGSIRSIMGSITDISHLKWAQGLQNRRLHEAEETRRQQNEFIDITSHEMRNPLSAILQCADDITSALAEHQRRKTSPPLSVVESCVEAAQTIALCVQHQKSIVDDILTISKMDSNLLLLTPSVARPIDILQRAVKIFDPELQAKDIDFVNKPHPSYHELDVDWVVIDPSRVLQILINLLTNAIKFTASATPIRRISVAIGASLTPPDMKHIPGFKFVPLPDESGLADVTASEEWGKGEVVYIRFKVHDTGCGLTHEDKQILFQRFKQASPRTHAQYGGSGLGLFISKRLAELHGGQIGVASESGKGSLFSFYVQTRRASPPNDIDMVDAAALPSETSDTLLPIERDIGGGATTTLQQRPTPQRQDFAISNRGPAAGLTMYGAEDGSLAGAPTPGSTPFVSADSSASLARTFDPRNVDVLVVEDNLINQKVLVKQLSKAGCRVSVANDGIEALAFLEGTQFCRRSQPGSSSSELDAAAESGGTPLSIILMDLEMPNMGGLTCVREIRKMQACGRVRGHVPIIAVTANVRDEQVASARRAGMDDVVSKPFRIPELLGKIESVLRVVEKS